MPGGDQDAVHPADTPQQEGNPPVNAPARRLAQATSAQPQPVRPRQSESTAASQKPAQSQRSGRAIARPGSEANQRAKAPATQPPSLSGTPTKPAAESVQKPPVLSAESVQKPTQSAQEAHQAELKKLKVTSTTYWHRAWQHYVKGKRIVDPQREKAMIEVRMPQDNEIEMAAAEQMYASMVGLGKKPGQVFHALVELFPKTEILFRNHDDAISFEMIADEKEIRFIVVTPKEWRDFIERQIHGAYPEADIDYYDGAEFIQEQGVIKLTEINLKGKIYYPIRVIEDFETDPLSSITTTISKLNPGERVIIQLLLQPADDVWRKRGQAFIQQAQAPPKEGETKKTVEPHLIEAVTSKVTKPGFRTVIRILVQAGDEFVAENISNHIVGSFDQFSQPHLAAFAKNKKFKVKPNTVVDFVTRSFPQRGNYPILNTLELATIYHFPNHEIQTPRINWLRSRKSAAPTNMPSEGMYLGVSEYRDSIVKVHIKQDDRRRHMYILGQTGTGKSEFLKHMAYQDIVNGEGLAFVDPHGEAVEDLLESIPKERAEDVVYFNPADSERPMGLNILDVKTEEAKHMTVNSFIALLYKLYDPNRTGMVGPQLERAVRNVMLTAMEEEGNSMVEVLRLLTNPKFAEKKIPLIKDPLVKAYWTEQIAQTTEQQRSETLGYFVSKFDRFVTEKIMRNIIGQSKSAFNFREIMDQQKILLVNLSKGRIGEENSNFLGLLLVPRILAAAMSRADMAKEDRKDFFLYVDEFQNFSTPDFAQILAEARKYRLNLVVANQFIAQIQEDIRNAVFGNVGTMISFRIGADDGEYMEKQFEPVFKQADLINQTIGQGVTKLLIDGHPSRAFSFRTDWPAIQAIPRNRKIADVVREISRLKYGRDQHIVEREIATRAGFD